jgi:tetratricopeptide (TPR) repeat protein
MPRKPQKEKTKKRNALFSARRIGLGVFLLALLVRGVYLVESRDNPTFRTPIVDSQTYDGLARRIADGQPITSEFFWQPPFYPLFLSFVYGLSHSSILWAKIIQAVLGALTCVLTYQLGKKIFGRRAGLIAALITAVYMPLVFYETELLAAGWASFLMVAVVLLLIKIQEKPTVRRGFVLGLAGALGIITRPEFLFFFGAACLWLILGWIRKRSGAAILIPGLVGMAFGFLVIAGPLGILSHRVTGRVRILPYSGGINFYIGNNPNYDKTITTRPGLGWRELTSAPARAGIMDDRGMERYFFKKAKEYIMSEPVSFLNGLAHKTAQFFNSREIPRNTDIYIFKKWSRLLDLFVWKIGRFGFPFGVLLPLAFLGLIFCWRTLPRPLLLALLLYPASMIMVFVTSRYRVPMVPVMSVLAAAGAGIMGEMRQKKEWKKLAAAGAIFLSVGVAGSAAGLFYEERLNYEAELYYGLGSTYDARGKVEEAKTAYSKAIDLRADYTEAHYNLANILKAEGRIDEAVEHYNQALQNEPASVEIRNNLGAALQIQGKIDQAVQQWEKALEIVPSDPNAHFNLGLALAGQGKFDRSIVHFKEALQKRPDWVEIHMHLGLILLQQGDISEAIEQFNETLRIRPDFADAHSCLGIALGSKGDYDGAMRRFREAIKLEPNHVEAHYNLGYALELQGRLDEAIAEYQRVLQIDPDHAQGRRHLESAMSKRRQDR